MSKDAQICCVLVHGTFSLRRWAHDPAAAIRRAIKARIPSVHFEPFVWSGWHSQTARSHAADELKLRLADLSHRYEKIIVIGHSHGGNVGLQAIQALGCQSIALATLATPFLYARSVNETRNLRAIIAGCLAVIFLVAVAAIFIGMKLWDLSTVFAFGTAVGLFAGAVLTSHGWLPRLIRGIAPDVVARRRMYEHMTLLRPLKILVIYYPDQDGVTKLFNWVHQTSLWVGSMLSRTVSKEDVRWTAWSCIGSCLG